MKTNAIRLLDQSKIPYRLITYKYDPENLDVGKIAAENGLELGQVFKTLICSGDKSGPFVAVIAGNEKLDLKHIAQISANKKVALLPVKNLAALTGYIRGGCSPIGTKKRLTTYLSATAEQYDEILINAGKRGLLFGSNPLLLAAKFDWTIVDMNQA